MDNINFIDKFFCSVAPSYGLSRLQNKATIQAWNNAYDASNKSEGVRKSSSHGKSIMGSEERNLNKYDRETLVLEGYNALRNNPVVVAAINRLHDFVVEGGIEAQAKTSDDKFNEQSETYFKNWSKVCDYRQRQNLAKFQKQIITALFVEGEIFFILMANGQITPIEANRVQTPKDLISNKQVVQGIKLTKGGIPLGIYICSRSENGYNDLNDYQFVSIENVIHIANIIRPDQIRGVPLLAPVLNNLIDKDEIFKNTLFKTKIDSMQSLVLTSNKSVTVANSTLNRNAKADTEADETYYEKTALGQFWKLKPGDDIKSITSNTPNSTFDSFQKRIAIEISAAFGIPYELLFLDFSSGIANSRSALTISSKTIKKFQGIISDEFIQRLWNWKIAQAIKNEEIIKAPVNTMGVSQWFKISFVTCGLDWIDPQAESASNLIDYQMGTKSLQDICKKRGVEFEDTLENKTYEIEFAIKKAKEINDKHGTNLSFRELLFSANNPGTFNNNQIEQQQAETKGKE